MLYIPKYEQYVIIQYLLFLHKKNNYRNLFRQTFYLTIGLLQNALNCII